MASSAILSNFSEEKWTQNHPQYFLGLSRALFPTTFLKIAVYTLVKYTGDTQFPFSEWHREATFAKERVGIKLLAPTIMMFVFISSN